MNRIRWIDNAKGIAILLIIIGHTSTKLSGFWNFQFVYGIHLVVFFLLSGYTFKKKTLTEEWINSKFKRLMVPYFYTCIAILFTDIITIWVNRLFLTCIIIDLTRLLKAENRPFCHK